MIEDESKHFEGKVSQKAIIANGQHILVCRGNGDTLWEFPGGRMHNEGTPAENLLREIKEELDIIVKNVTPLHVGLSTHMQSNTKRILITYSATTSSKDFTLDRDELEEAKWITPEELKELPLFDDCRAAADHFLALLQTTSKL